MARILVLSGPHKRSKPKYAAQFSKSINKHEFTDLDLAELVISISEADIKISDSFGNQIEEYDLVMIREYSGAFVDIAYTVSRYLEIKGRAFFNRNYLKYNPTSKLAQSLYFFEASLPIPKTFFSLNEESLVNQAEQNGYPMVLKDAQGSHGDKNFLIKSSNELLETLRSNSSTKFILQEYVPSEGDYRILVMGNNEPLQIKRSKIDDSHLSNTSKGAEAKLVEELPPTVIEGAKRISRAIGVDLAGVDVIKNNQTGDYFYLEINFQPQIISGALISDKMIGFERLLEELLS